MDKFMPLLTPCAVVLSSYLISKNIENGIKSHGHSIENGIKSHAEIFGNHIENGIKSHSEIFGNHIENGIKSHGHSIENGIKSHGISIRLAIESHGIHHESGANHIKDGIQNIPFENIWGKKNK